MLSVYLLTSLIGVCFVHLFFNDFIGSTQDTFRIRSRGYSQILKAYIFSRLMMLP